MQVPDFATNRGGPSTLEWSNIYWANRIAAGVGKSKVVALSISGEGTKGIQIADTNCSTQGLREKMQKYLCHIFEHDLTNTLLLQQVNIFRSSPRVCGCSDYRTPSDQAS
jgi:hypothetical protein